MIDQQPIAAELSPLSTFTSKFFILKRGRMQVIEGISEPLNAQKWIKIGQNPVWRKKEPVPLTLYLRQLVLMLLTSMVEALNKVSLMAGDFWLCFVLFTAIFRAQNKEVVWQRRC